MVDAGGGGGATIVHVHCDQSLVPPMSARVVVQVSMSVRRLGRTLVLDHDPVLAKLAAVARHSGSAVHVPR